MEPVKLRFGGPHPRVGSISNKEKGGDAMEPPKRQRVEENVEEGKQTLKTLPKRAIKNTFKQFDVLKQKYISTSETLH